MTRTFTGLCIAGAFAFAASAAAQSNTSTAAQTADREVTVTGCLAKSGDGSYILTNADVEPAHAATSGASGASASASSAPSAVAGTSGSTAPATSPSSREAHPASMSTDTTWTLQGGTDLDKHVGHKIQVTGNAAWSTPEHSGNGFSSTGAASASTGSTTATMTGTTSGSASGGEQRSPAGSSTTGTSNAHPRLDVQSVKMVASSCS
jgi:hypothetical protein